MFIKIHKTYRDIVAICDEELIGKKFEEGKFQLEVKENFYKGEKISEEKALKTMQDMLKEDATFNIVGEKSVNIALKTGIVSDQEVKEIQGIPFALKLLYTPNSSGQADIATRQSISAKRSR